MSFYDFTGANGSALPVDWTVTSGTINIQNNKASASGVPAAISWVAIVDSGSTDGTYSYSVNAGGSASSSGGVIFRYVDNDTCWAALISATSGGVDLYKRTAGAWAAQGLVYTIPAFSASADYLLEVRLAGDDIVVAVDGTDRIYLTDSYLNTATKHGFRLGNVSHTADNYTATLPVVVTDSITLTNPRLTNKIESGNITVPITGSYTGSPAQIRARVVYSVTGLPVTGLDWYTLDAAPTGGVFDGTVVIPDSNLAYKLEVDFSNDALVAGQSTEFWSAVHVLIDGQSLAFYMSEEGSTLTPHAKVRGFDGSSYFVPTIGDGTIQLMNSLQSTLDRFIVVFNSAVGARSLLKVNESSLDNYVWKPSDPMSNPLYANIINGVSALGGVDAHISIMGETDARIHVATKATYKSELNAFYNDIRTRTGLAALPTIITPVGARTDTFDVAEWEDVRQAQFEVANDDINNYYTAHYDLPLRDVVHHTNAANIVIANRLSNTLLANVYSQAVDWRLPLISSVVAQSTTETIVTLQHGDGADFTPTTGITGFELSTDGVSFPVVIAAAERLTANTIKLSHAVQTITNYRYMYGNQINVSAPIIDNSSLGLPAFSKSGTVLAGVRGVLGSAIPLGSAIDTSDVIVDPLKYYYAVVQLPAPHGLAFTEDGSNFRWLDIQNALNDSFASNGVYSFQIEIFEDEISLGIKTVDVTIQ